MPTDIIAQVLGILALVGVTLVAIGQAIGDDDKGGPDAHA